MKTAVRRLKMLTQHKCVALLIAVVVSSLCGDSVAEPERWRLYGELRSKLACSPDGQCYSPNGRCALCGQPCCCSEQTKSGTAIVPQADRIAVADDPSAVVQAQATVDAPAQPSAPSATGQTTSTEDNLFNPAPAQTSALGWLNNVFTTGLQSTVSVAPSVDDAAARNSAFIEAKTDAASLLQGLPGVAFEERAAGQNDPVLGGRRLGQVPARGSYWFPARQDLDTLLSKIDSRLVREITAINGPYSVLYGPGLSFYDVQLLASPRFEHGYSSYGSSSVDYKTNGQRWNGHQSFWGGSKDWGFRVGYGHRTGSDYESGNGTQFPASYKSRMTNVMLGADLTGDSAIEFGGLRLDQTDVEYAGQLFDMNFLVTDAYEVRYVLEDQPRYDALSVEGWYNRTRFDGDNLRKGKRLLFPGFDDFLGGRLESFTDVDAMSTGYRIAFQWGDEDQGQLIAGTDFRYLKQNLNETDIIRRDPPFLDTQQDFSIPHAHSSNPGLFFEAVFPTQHRLSVRSGARFDWVSANADDPLDSRDFDQHFDLWSAYVTADYRVNDHVTAQAGAGHAMRPPTMTELYADGPFIAALPQYSLTSLLGDSGLAAERMWQMDAGIQTDYGQCRGGIHGFYAWIDNYITLDFLSPPNGLLFQYLNTDLATLSGAEVYGEYDVSCNLTTFATISYVEGRDHSRDDAGSVFRQLVLPGTPRSDSTSPEEPLPAIAPLEGDVGISLHESGTNPRWAVEFSTRIVDHQDRIASSLREQPTPGFTTFALRGYMQAFANVLMTAGVHNFTDKNYQEHLDAHDIGNRNVAVLRPGISFYFGTEVSY